MNLVPNEIKEVTAHEMSLEIAAKNPAVKMMDLKTPIYGNDPNEIIKHRFLYRGGICILSGATGAGKSSFTMQWAINLAGGDSHFGLLVGDCYYRKGMKVIVIQAENDEGDLAEQRDGVLKVIPPDVIDRASENLQFITMPDASGESFAVRLKAICQVHEPDVVFIDPVFSFLGGDNSAQKDVSHFVRNLLMPVLMEHKVAAILMHHVNKPKAKKDQVESGSYHMAGSAEWANAARCALSIECVGDGVFALTATKRGDRLWWRDSEDNKCLKRYIAHHGGLDDDGRPIIAWRDAEADEIPDDAEGRKGGKVTVKDVVRSIPKDGSITSGDLLEAVMRLTDASKSAVRERMSEALQLELLEVMKVGRTAYYSEKVK